MRDLTNMTDGIINSNRFYEKRSGSMNNASALMFISTYGMGDTDYWNAPYHLYFGLCNPKNSQPYCQTMPSGIG